MIAFFFSNLNQMSLNKLKCGFDKFSAERRKFWSAKSGLGVLKTATNPAAKSVFLITDFEACLSLTGMNRPLNFPFPVAQQQPVAHA